MSPEAVEHGLIADHDAFKGSGRDVSAPKAPLVSVNPTSQPQGFQAGLGEKSDRIIVDNPNWNIDHSEHPKADADYPFLDLKSNQGMFIPVEKNGTTDALMEKVYKAVAVSRAKYSEVNRNVNGDEIHNMVIVKTRKRNADGSLELRGDGSIIEGANQEHHPQYSYAANFLVKAVVKDDDLGGGQKAPSDGAFVIRT